MLVKFDIYSVTNRDDDSNKKYHKAMCYLIDIEGLKAVYPTFVESTTKDGYGNEKRIADFNLNFVFHNDKNIVINYEKHDGYSMSYYDISYSIEKFYDRIKLKNWKELENNDEKICAEQK
jgi:hypothetical protein